MEGIREFLIKLREQGGSFWSSLSLAKKIVGGAVIGLVVFVLIALFALTKEDGYEYLFVNMSAEDATEITAFLKKSNFTDFVLDQKGIKVPTKRVPELRIKLAQEGLPAHGLVGWEKFDNSDFTRTEFEQRINKLRAIQGELARTIMQIATVDTARVHIVQPKSSLFVEDKKETTASVYLKSKRGQRLESRQVRGIVHLVSRAVEGLNPDNITVLDSDGRMLTEEKSKDSTVRQMKEMLATRRNVEKNLEERVRGIVGRVVGPDRVEAKIDVQIDYTREELTDYDIDPDKVAVISSNTSNMDLSGSGLNPTGIPGSKSNVPGEQEALNLGSSQTTNKKDTERINYEIAKTISKRILPFGTINRISAAVLVDGKQPYTTDGTIPEFQPRTEEEMAKIRELVKSAIGFVDGRDNVEVQNLQFQMDQFQIQTITQEKKENREYFSTLVKSGLVALALVFFFAFIVRPYFRWLSYDPERKKQEAIVEEYRPDLELGSIQHVQVKEDVPFEKLSPQEQVVYLAKHEPQRTTEAIRILLNPHSSA